MNTQNHFYIGTKKDDEILLTIRLEGSTYKSQLYCMPNDSVSLSIQ